MRIRNRMDPRLPNLISDDGVNDTGCRRRAQNVHESFQAFLSTHSRDPCPTAWVYSICCVRGLPMLSSLRIIAFSSEVVLDPQKPPPLTCLRMHLWQPIVLSITHHEIVHIAEYGAYVRVRGFLFSIC